MKKLLFLFLLFPSLLFAQQSKDLVTIITKDSLSKAAPPAPGFRLIKNWRFQKGDSVIYADPGYDDNSWKVVNADIRTDSELSGKHGYYSRVDWYRLHLYIDSSVVVSPLAILFAGSGAMEIYLDGKKIKNYGSINTNGKREFVDPQTVPFTFSFGSAGDHLLAVRFANYSTRDIFKNEINNITGFQMCIGEANTIFQGIYNTLNGYTAMSIFIVAFFLVLSLTHLILFLYNRAIKSNLYYSIFCFTFSGMSFIGYLGVVVIDKSILFLLNNWIGPAILSVMYLSFSGLNNELFSRNKLRFRIIAVLCVIAFVITVSPRVYDFAFGILGILVLLEALILPVSGIRRKIKGARIVGGGVLLFAILIPVIILLGVFEEKIVLFWGLSENSTDVATTVLVLCALLSIPISMSVYLSWNFANMNKELIAALIANEKINTILKDHELKSVNEMLEVQESERRRIATDLHDRLGSMLSTVKLYFGSVEDQIDKMKQLNREQYHKANTILDEACDEVRKISHDLVSGELVKFGLVAALKQLTQTIEDSGQIKIKTLAFGMDNRLESATEIALYRIVQELLSNILKHSRATQVTIQLNKAGNNLNIVVEDNGTGFDPAAVQANTGLGLKNVETRVHKLNGNIHIDSGKGRGTTTIIDIPAP